MKNLFKNQHTLTEHILERINEKLSNKPIFPDKPVQYSGSASVLLLLGQSNKSNKFEPCVILNKRSQNVRQPGDICCPGGGIEYKIDPFISKFLSIRFLPFLPLARWRFWEKLRKEQKFQSDQLAIAFATGLRESFEEMRLNPLCIKFLGALPSEHLVLFKREIFPMLVWVPHQKRFFLNQEVEKVLYIPVRKLLNRSYYSHHELKIISGKNQTLMSFPCFRYDSEVLWGATYRIVTKFLEMVFDFKVPDKLSPGLPEYINHYVDKKPE